MLDRVVGLLHSAWPSLRGAGIAWLDPIADAVTALSLLAIAGTLAGVMKRVHDLPHRRLYAALSIFAAAAGGAHFLGAIAPRTPSLGGAAIARILAATALAAAALLLASLVPRTLAMARAAKVARDRGAAL